MNLKQHLSYAEYQHNMQKARNMLSPEDYKNYRKDYVDAMWLAMANREQTVQDVMNVLEEYERRLTRDYAKDPSNAYALIKIAQIGKLKGLLMTKYGAVSHFNSPSQSHNKP